MISLHYEGAGKKATLEIVAGKSFPTSGDVTINGISLVREHRKYIRQLGYCPDKSPFLEELSGLEILRLVGTLRKIPSEVLDSLITNLSLRLLFIHDLESRVFTYNMVSQKKLSAAAAMLGYPPVVLFNEPSVGIDPLSKEYLFNSIRSLISRGSIVMIISQKYEQKTFFQDFSSKIYHENDVTFFSEVLLSANQFAPKCLSWSTAICDALAAQNI
jgi:ABC-2 type transport system ATP-binding protein